MERRGSCLSRRAFVAGVGAESGESSDYKPALGSVEGTESPCQFLLRSRTLAGSQKC
jgi:hypothetical protein